MNDILRILKKYPLAIAMAVLALGAFFYGSNLKGKIATQTDELAKLERRERTMQTNLRHGEGLREDVAQAGVLVEKVEARLYKPEQTSLHDAFLFQTLQDFRDRGLTISSYDGPSSVAPGPLSGPYHQVKYSFSVSGELATIIDFVNTIRTDFSDKPLASNRQGSSPPDSTGAGEGGSDAGSESDEAFPDYLGSLRNLSVATITGRSDEISVTFEVYFLSNQP